MALTFAQTGRVTACNAPLGCGMGSMLGQAKKISQLVIPHTKIYFWFISENGINICAVPITFQSIDKT
jgi:hypothetical protein